MIQYATGINSELVIGLIPVAVPTATLARLCSWHGESMSNRVEEIESRRLEALEVQAAHHGPNTDPAILIEIAELKHKRRNSSSAERRQFVSGLDYQFLMDVVAAALIRIGQLERNDQDDDRRRHLRQLIHDLWMIVITIMVFLLLLLVVYGR